MKTINSCGTIPSKIMLVGEAPNNEEIAANNPFSGYTMNELSKCLFEAGIPLQSCYRTHVLKFFPPNGDASTLIAIKKKEITANHIPLYNRQVLPQLLNSIDVLKHEIEACQPNVIIAFGNVALFALTGNWGIMSWRSSLLECSINTSLDYKPKVIPTYSISLVHRMWSWRWILVHDLKRAQKESTSKELIRQDRKFIIRPTYETAITYLHNILKLLENKLKISVDIETKYYHIETIAFALDRYNAICIPFLDEDGLDYWEENEETNLVYTIYKILTHENVNVIGQNFSYDDQYIWKKWLTISNLSSDTMLQQHCIFASAKKDLSFLSSLYVPDHSHWKDEGKDSTGETRWIYNCKDACITYEVDESQQAILKALNLTNIAEFQNRLFKHVQRMIRKGIKFDKAKAEVFDRTLINLVQEREDWLTNVLGFLPNVLSPLQMSDLFYRLLNQKPCYNRSSGSKSVDDKALHVIADREPMLAQLCEAISEIRTINKLLDITRVQLSHDGRFRSNLNIGGTITYRFASSNDAFGEGTNVQNITDGKRSTIKLPNLRELFIPDLNNIYFDADLDSADLRIVAAEAGLDEMFAMLNEGKKVYVEVMKEYFRNPSLTKDDSFYTTFKSLCHGTHYLGTPSGLARQTGLLVEEVERIQKWYYGKFPGLRKWQNDIKDQVFKRKMVQNIFGYRNYIFDRIEGNVFNEAIAWIPQCLPLDHEVLTKQGWKIIADIQESEEIAIWESNGTIHFEIPEQWNYGNTTKLINLEDLHVLCTENHRIPYFLCDDKINLKVKTASNLPKSAQIPRIGIYSGTQTISEDILALRIALQADGSYDNYRDSISFEFQKDRKIERLENILTKLNIRFTKTIVRREATCFYIPRGHGIDKSFKHFGHWLLDLSGDNLDFILSEIEFWDGWRDPNGVLWYSSSIPSNCDWVITIATLRGKRARWLSTDRRGKNPNYRITIANNKGKYSTTKTSLIELDEPIKVACPTVSSGFFLIRHNNEISVTGNSSIACLVNRALVTLSENFPNKLDILQQTHDSLAGQCPIDDKDYFEPYIKSALEIELPYDKPIRIPADVHWSLESWGKCK